MAFISIGRYATIAAALCLAPSSAAIADPLNTALIVNGGPEGSNAAVVTTTEDPAAAAIRLYPDRAQRAGKEGETKVHCVVAADGHLAACQVVNEAPEGFGFADASLKLAEIFHIEPPTTNGAPVSGASYTFSVHWRLPKSVNPASPPEIGLGTDHVPSVGFRSDFGAAMRRFYPERALLLGKVGQAQVRCMVTSIGALVGCFVLKEEPAGFGFGEASLNLVLIYRLQPRTQDGVPVAGAFYTFNVDWKPPPPKRPVTAPQPTNSHPG